MKTNHTFLSELENLNSVANYKIDKNDLLFDIKVLLKDYYLATFTENENKLKLCFNNGQVFYLSLDEQ